MLAIISVVTGCSLRHKTRQNYLKIEQNGNDLIYTLKNCSNIRILRNIKELWGNDENLLYLNWDMNYMDICVWQNTLNSVF